MHFKRINIVYVILYKILNQVRNAYKVKNSICNVHKFVWLNVVFILRWRPCVHKLNDSIILYNLWNILFSNHFFFLFVFFEFISRSIYISYFFSGCMHENYVFEFIFLHHFFQFSRNYRQFLLSFRNGYNKIKMFITRKCFVSHGAECFQNAFHLNVLQWVSQKKKISMSISIVSHRFCVGQ